MRRWIHFWCKSREDFIGKPFPEGYVSVHHLIEGLQDQLLTLEQLLLVLLDVPDLPVKNTKPGPRRYFLGLDLFLS